MEKTEDTLKVEIASKELLISKTIKYVYIKWLNIFINI